MAHCSVVTTLHWGRIGARFRKRKNTRIPVNMMNPPINIVRLNVAADPFADLKKLPVVNPITNIATRITIYRKKGVDAGFFWLVS